MKPYMLIANTPWQIYEILITELIVSHMILDTKDSTTCLKSRGSTIDYTIQPFTLILHFTYYFNTRYFNTYHRKCNNNMRPTILLWLQIPLLYNGYSVCKLKSQLPQKAGFEQNLHLLHRVTTSTKTMVLHLKQNHFKNGNIKWK